MARRRKGRAIDGVVLVDKPAGVSSNQVLQRIKRLYGAAKAGHTGALDPLATGMLPLCLGEATKFSQFLLDADKRYQTTAKLGVITASDDADGEVLEEHPIIDVTAEKIQALLKTHFNGEITQTPSMFSALKHEGQPLYKLARKGIEVPVKQRQVTIYAIEMLDFRGDEIDLDIRCSKGTYVRSIVADLGKLLGCGAHVSVLRRLDSGPYTAAMMQTPEQLEAIAEHAAQMSADDLAIDENAEKTPESPDLPDELVQKCVHQALDNVLLPPWSAVEHLPKVVIDSQQLERVQYGNAISLHSNQGVRVSVDVPSDTLIDTENSENTDLAYTGLVMIFAQTEATARLFLGMGEISEARVLAPKRLVVH